MKTQFADSTKVVEFVPHILDLKRTLVSVDFSETSKKAFPYALKSAEQFSCEITLLIVVQPMSPMVGAPLAVEAFCCGASARRKCPGVHGCLSLQSCWKAGSPRKGSQIGSSLKSAGVTTIGGIKKVLL